MKKELFIILLILLTILSSCAKQDNFESENRQIDIIINNITVTSEIVDTYDKIMRGLMFREELGEFNGMFFVFADEVERSFWMKNTLIPLDIIFIDSGLNIVKIQHADPCDTDPCAIYPSNKPAMFVLEVNKGFSEKYGIKEGSKIEIVNYR